MSKCPVCESEAEIKYQDYQDKSVVNCKRCGKFKISQSAVATLERSPIGASKYSVSHWIRKQQAGQEYPYLDTYAMEKRLREVVLPSPREQADNLILYIGDHSESVSIGVRVNAISLMAIVGTINVVDLRYIAKELYENKVLIFDELDISRTDKDGNPVDFNFTFHLTFKGWDRYDELTKKTTSGSYAFMAMQYGDSYHDEIYEDFFKPSVAETGIELRRLDENLTAGLIDDQLRVAIRNCKFILADLTKENSGVYWESGYAEGLGKQVIYMYRREKGEENMKPHFDTNHHTTIFWNEEKISEAMKNLKATIRATFPGEVKMNDEQIPGDNNVQ